MDYSEVLFGQKYVELFSFVLSVTTRTQWSNGSVPHRMLKQTIVDMWVTPDFV